MTPFKTLALLAALALPVAAAAAEIPLSAKEQLGKALFFDGGLSEPAGQACASCHAPLAGFTSPDSERNKGPAIVAGAAPGRAGNRTPPSVAYTLFNVRLHFDPDVSAFEGGFFRDGRAESLIEQASGPLTNPLEMNNPDMAAVCRKVAAAPYAGQFAAAFGQPLNCAGDGPLRIAQALAEFETSREVNPFSSKYDAYMDGRATLSPAESRGLALFQGKAKCDVCHPSRLSRDGDRPLFTDFGYDNIGAPRNPANPFYTQPKSVNPAGAAYVDPGVGAILKKPSLLGAFKAPTLRNVAAGGEGFTRAYMHNGALKSLEEVMEFYSDRDRRPGHWVPEEPRHINKQDMGNLHLTTAEKADIIAFLKTLTDGWSETGK